jgi:hypothetical protein
MIRGQAESIPRVIETSAVRLHFCHDWTIGRARRPLDPEQQARTSQFNTSLHSEVDMHTASSPSLNRWKTLYQAAILETNKGLLPQRVSEAEEAVKARGREIFNGNGTPEENLHQRKQKHWKTHSTLCVRSELLGSTANPRDSLMWL